MNSQAMYSSFAWITRNEKLFFDLLRGKFLYVFIFTAISSFSVGIGFLLSSLSFTIPCQFSVPAYRCCGSLPCCFHTFLPDCSGFPFISMASSAPSVLLLGHSFIRRLRDDLRSHFDLPPHPSEIKLTVPWGVIPIRYLTVL